MIRGLREGRCLHVYRLASRREAVFVPAADDKPRWESVWSLHDKGVLCIKAGLGSNAHVEMTLTELGVAVAVQLEGARHAA